MIEALTTPGDGWAVAPAVLAVIAILAAVAVAAARASIARAEADLARREAEAAAAGRREDARRCVRAYADRGYSPRAIRLALHGGPMWCAEVDLAIAELGPTGTVPTARPRGDA